MVRDILQRRPVHYVFLILLCGLIYAGTLDVPFQFDDVPNIVHNPIIKNFSYFSAPGSAQEFQKYEAFRSRYMGYLSFFLNYRLHGFNVAGYHVINIFVHVFNTLLLYMFMVLSFQTPVLRKSVLFELRPSIAFIAAALFAVHPVNTQAVTYIVQRLASLSAMFYLGSMVCYTKTRLSEKKPSGFAFYFLCLLFSVLAMKTKENSFTLPLAILIYEVMFFRGEKLKNRAILLLPLLITMLIIPLTLVALDKPVAQVMADVAEKTAVQPISRTEYLVTEMRVVSTYVRLLILPLNQTLDYDYPRFSSLGKTPVILSALVIFSLLVLAAYLYKRKEPSAKLASYGIVFFFLALTVESTVIPLYPIYEHRLYLPIAGASMAFSVGALWLYNRVKMHLLRYSLIFLCVTAILVLAVQTIKRNTVWQSELSLWSDVVKKAPDNARGQMALGIAYDNLGEFDLAEKHYQTAIRLWPAFSDAYINLGASYGMQGKFVDALEALEKAVSLAPENSDAYNNLGNIFFELQEFDTAAGYYVKALEHNAGAIAPRVNLIKIFLYQRKVSQARKELERLKIISPEEAEILTPLFEERW